jgi:hypothetical protein
MDTEQLLIGLDLGQDLLTVHLGQVQVQQHDVRPRDGGVLTTPTQEIDSLLPVPGHVHGLGMAGSLENLLDQQDIAGVVVHDQHDEPAHGTLHESTSQQIQDPLHWLGRPPSARILAIQFLVLAPGSRASGRGPDKP